MASFRASIQLWDNPNLGSFSAALWPKARGLTKSLHLPEHRALCDLLVATRRKAGLTQQAVAKRLKRPQSFVAKYEGGERRLDMIEFIAVADALKSDPIRLLRAFLKRLSFDYPQ